MARLRLAVSATEDIRDIRIYSKAQFGAAVARGYLLGLDHAIHLIGERPTIGAQETDLGVGVRGLTFRSHRIYYRFSGDQFLVIRILHHARDARRWIGAEA